MSSIFDQLTEKYPFISLLTYGDNEYIGIIQNRDQLVTSFYDFSAIRSDLLKQQFLDLGEQWWWESNRSIPINIFLKSEWAPFRQCLRSFNSKDVVIVHGPVVSLAEFSNKKTKRRSITLVRKVQ